MDKDLQEKWRKLPPDIVFAVLWFMTRRELLLNVAPVCKLWYELANHKQLWWHHTFIDNPYYYENKNVEREKLLAIQKSFFFPETTLQTSQSPFSPTSTSSSTPLTPVTPVTPATPVTTVIPVNPAAQVYSFKHYLYNLDRMSSKKVMKHIDPLLILECKHYFFERIMMAKFSRTCEGSSKAASSGEKSPSLLEKVKNKLFGDAPLFERDEELEKKIGSNTNNNIPQKRYRHTFTKVDLSPDKQGIYLIGGLRLSGYNQTADVSEDVVYVLESCTSFKPDNNHITFKAIKVTGKPPHIGKHSAVLFGSYKEKNLRIAIFGGVENEQVTNHLYIFDLQTNEWQKMKPNNNGSLWPSARTNHQAAAVGTDMYVVGGGVGDNMTPTNEVWVYNVESNEWRQVQCKGLDVFTPRLGFVMTAINRKLVIYGGGFWFQRNIHDRFWKEKYSELFIFDVDSNLFTKIETTGISPQTGTFPSQVHVGTHWYIIGGAYEDEISNEIYCLDTVTFSWRRVDQKFYGGDSLAATSFTFNGENKIIVFGGYCYHPLGTFEIFKLKYTDILNQRGLNPLRLQYSRKNATLLHHPFKQLV